MSKDAKEFRFHKFRRGDRVKFLSNLSHVVRILPQHKDTGENRYEVKGQWGGFTHKVGEDELTFYTDDLKESKEDKVIEPKCPKCGSEWIVSGFGASKWKDCIKCKKKAEEL